MNKNRWLLILSLALLLVFTSACGENSPANQENDAVKNSANQNASSNSNDSADSEPAEAPTETPSPTQAATNVPIVHELIPLDPVFRDQQTIRDCNTGQRLGDDGSLDIGLGCDFVQENSYERPYDEAQSYLAGMDIVEATLGRDDIWFYVRIEMFESESATTMLTGDFAIELDLNLDSKGDVLLLANDLESAGTEWSVSGVQVWFDANGDVGGKIAAEADDGGTDGYETLVFDSGLGDDPDLTWVRIDPENGNVVQFAFKNTLPQEIATQSSRGNGMFLMSNSYLQSSDLFIWWVWVGSNLDPASFDFNDLLDMAARFALDNSCAWTYGGLPRDVPLHCSFFVPTPTPEPTQEKQKRDDPAEDNSCQEPAGGCGGSKVWYQCQCQIIN